MLFLGSQSFDSCESDALEAQIADVFSDSKKVTKFRMQHIIYDSKCEVVLSQWIYECALSNGLMRSYTVSGCSIQNANCDGHEWCVMRRSPLQRDDDFCNGAGYEGISGSQSVGLRETGDQHMVRLAEHPLFARRV